MTLTEWHRYHFDQNDWLTGCLICKEKLTRKTQFPPPFVNGGNQDFKQDMLVGVKKGQDSIYCGSSMGEYNLSILIWGHVQNITSLTVALS